MVQPSHGGEQTNTLVSRRNRIRLRYCQGDLGLVIGLLWRQVGRQVNVRQVEELIPLRRKQFGQLFRQKV